MKAAVVVPPAAVPGAVQPRSGARAERVSDQLVAREHGAAEIDVTEDADRDGCQCVIEHVHPVRAGGPVGHDPLLLFGGDDLDVAESAIGMLGERSDDAVQPAGEPLDRGPVIQFRSIDDVAAVAGCRTVLRIREEVQRQVGLGHVEARFQRRERRPVVDHLLPGKLFAHMYDHLEQRVAGQRARRVDDLDDLLEGHVGVRVSRQRRLAGPHQDLAQRGIAAQIVT